MRRNVLFLLLTYIVAVSAQNTYRSPLDIPLVLSANFGELRSNHFHSGVDFKTQGVINKRVYSIEDGYISRISVSPSGYGLALYVSHPNGHTSVYAHLEQFVAHIAEYVEKKQYELENYRVDISLKADEIPVKRGEFIAYSGNTGSSGGPHVHFEIRNSENQLAIDPLVFYKELIKDVTPPQLKGIAVYPIDNKGVVNECSESPFRTSIQTDKTGKYLPIKDTIKVWGRIGIGVYTNDRMTGTNNIYGVKTVRLFCDEKEIFASDITSVDFGNTRLINLMTDFDFWRDKGRVYQKSFIEPGNSLPIYKTVNNGFVEILEEKIYDFRYVLEDLYGNRTEYMFSVQGVQQELPPMKECTQSMLREEDNYYEGELFAISIPKESLYKNLCFVLKKQSSAKHLSSLYKVNDTYVPLSEGCDITIKLTKDSLINKSNYGIVRVKGNNDYWVGGTYHNGAMKVSIGELGGTYAVSYDNEAPIITPIHPAKWVTEGKIVIKLTDNKSGVSSFRGEINGGFALFKHDAKSPLYTYRLDSKRLKKGEKHKLVFSATDACGNSTHYEYEFTY